MARIDDFKYETETDKEVCVRKQWLDPNDSVLNLA